MKLLLSINKPNILKYEQYVDPIQSAVPIGEDIRALNSTVDNSCEDIIIDEFLESIPSHNIEKFIQTVCKKMRHGCMLTIYGKDIFEVAKSIYTARLKEKEANEIIFGKGDNPWNQTNGMYSLEFITKLLQANGLDIVKRRINGYSYSIEAMRP